MSAVARNRMKNWEVIADNLSRAGWSSGCVSALDSAGRTIWIVDAHRGDGKRFIVRADEKLTAFMELESAVQAASVAHCAQKATDHSARKPFCPEPDFVKRCLSVTDDVAFHAVVRQSRPAAFASLQAVVPLLHPSSKTVDTAGCVNGVPDVIVNECIARWDRSWNCPSAAITHSRSLFSSHHA